MKNSQNKNFEESTISDTTDWNAIKWHKVEKYVDKLQKRIYHAESENNSRQVRNLQRILIHSNATLLLAIKKVTQINKGKQTPGIDGFRALNDKKRGELFDTMKNMNIKLHSPKPAYRMYIKKKNGKLRSLGIPAITDRIYQEIIRMALEPQFEVNFRTD
jgi:RNA-directed DNA polymerase